MRRKNPGTKSAKKIRRHNNKNQWDIRSAEKGTFNRRNEEKKSGDKIRQKKKSQNNNNSTRNPFCRKPSLSNSSSPRRKSPRALVLRGGSVTDLCWLPELFFVLSWRSLLRSALLHDPLAIPQWPKPWQPIPPYPLRRNDYQNNSINIFSCNCPGAITGFSCRAPENTSPKIVSCMGPCPVRAPPCNSPWGYYRIFL